MIALPMTNGVRDGIEEEVILQESFIDDFFQNIEFLFLIIEAAPVINFPYLNCSILLTSSGLTL